jgi:hypothetical protein
MRRKMLLLSVGLMVCSVLGLLAALVLLTRHEPSFYRNAAIPVGPQRTEWSREFDATAKNFIAWIINGGDAQTGNWNGKFGEHGINSYLAEQFVTTGLAQRILPEGVREPRIVLEQDRIRLGFRYGEPPWSTVIAIDFRVWLAQHEQNVVVLELQALHAGALPISAQSLLQQISESLRSSNIQVTWFRHNGNPTAAVKFNTDQPRPTCQVRQVELKPGTLAIFGHSSEPLSPAPPADFRGQ